MTDLKEICRQTEKTARTTGEFILKESKGFDPGRAESKGFNDFVSYVDKGAEKMIVDQLSLIIPEAGFITEEGTSQKRGPRYNWVIDPVDGTTNFLHGLNPFAISIALMDNDEIVAGVVYVIKEDEMFTAWKGGGAWLNGKSIQTSGAAKLSDSLIATGFPYNDFGLLDSYMKCLTYFCQNTHGIRRLGSAATDIAYVACGRFEAFYEYGLHPWDIAAGIILVREAGGHISDFRGNEKNYSGDDFIASNGSVHSEIREIISSFMHK